MIFNTLHLSILNIILKKMTKILFGSLFFLILSCNSKQSQIEDSVKVVVNSTFDDPNSYEFIEAKTLDTVGLNKELKHQQLVVKSCKSIILNSNFMILNGNIDDVIKAGKKKKENTKELQFAENKVKNLQDFKSGKILKISHKYRAKNKDGALILETDTIYIKI
jgi:hypothetical protein